MLLYNDDLRRAHYLKEAFYKISQNLKYSHLTNGPTEGINNKIKVVKRTSYGISRFDRLRKRIFPVTN